MVPPLYVGLFDAVAVANGNAVTLPFEIWREAFIDDADLALAQSSYAKLNPHPYRTFTQKIALRKPLAELPVAKSYVNCRQDTALPHGLRMGCRGIPGCRNGWGFSGWSNATGA